jgi:hypothetical protein
MAAISKQEADQIRSKIDVVAQRARSDGAYMTSFKTDPVGTLRAAGLPDAAIVDVMRDEGMEAEVSGYMKSECWLSCPCTGCCVTSF